MTAGCGIKILLEHLGMLVTSKDTGTEDTISQFG
jgi:hypothetical protein